MIHHIDINADIGEGTGEDHLIMPYISSCNIACGGHTGNRETIKQTLLLAQKHEVKVGAHPSYPDQVNFGRTSLSISIEALQESLQNQLQLFFEVCEEVGIQPHHIKCHGALYNDLVKDEAIATVLIHSLQTLKRTLPLYTLENGTLAKKAKGIFPIIPEAFIDRNYRDNGTLVPRSEPKAIIENPEEAFNHLLRMVQEQKIKTVTGQFITTNARTYCIHSDHKNAKAIALYVHTSLSKHHIALR